MKTYCVVGHARMYGKVVESMLERGMYKVREYTLEPEYSRPKSVRKNTMVNGGVR